MRVWICEVAALTQGRAPACTPEKPLHDERCRYRNVPTATVGPDIDPERKFRKVKEEGEDASLER